MSNDPWAVDEPSPFAEDIVITEETPIPGEIVSTPMTTNIEVEKPLTITLKAGSGYDAPWVVFRADTSAEAKKLMTDMANESLLDGVASAAKAFQTKYGGATKSQAKSSTTKAAPSGDTPPVETCSHGDRKYSTGNKKNGGTWRAHFCPEKKCDPIWV